jgi:hypothetical protein
MIDVTSGPFRLLSGRGDAPVGYGAGTVSLDELGQGAWKAVGTFHPLVARYGLKNVPTRIEIIAELLACHAGAPTNSPFAVETGELVPRTRNDDNGPVPAHGSSRLRVSIHSSCLKGA